MSEIITQIHDEVIEEFRELCRFCKEGVEAHANGVCLFEPTLFTPMSLSEWMEWRKAYWLALPRQRLEAQPKGTLLKLDGPTYVKQEEGLLWVPPPPPIPEVRWSTFEMLCEPVDLDP